MTTPAELNQLAAFGQQKFAYGGLLEGIGPTGRDVTISALCLAPLKRALRCSRRRRAGNVAKH